MTGSGLAVAVVSAARTMPMLLLGAFAGVMSEAVDRKRVLLIGQFITSGASATVAMLAMFGAAQPWHVGIAALLAGIVWSTEMSTRRRMVGESVPARTGAARLGPRYADQLDHPHGRPHRRRHALPVVGLAGAFTASSLMYLLAALLALGLRYQQQPRRFILSDVPRDLAEAFAFARGHVVIAGVLRSPSR